MTDGLPVVVIEIDGSEWYERRLVDARIAELEAKLDQTPTNAELRRRLMLSVYRAEQAEAAFAEQADRISGYQDELVDKHNTLLDAEAELAALKAENDRLKSGLRDIANTNTGGVAPWRFAAARLKTVESREARP